MCSSTCATTYGTVFWCFVSSVYDVNLELIHFTCSSPPIFPRKKYLCLVFVFLWVLRIVLSLFRSSGGCRYWKMSMMWLEAGVGSNLRER
mmetsp:Transcript_30220/g.30693  ORF Transcript_30220/g.30693 Transcript_30220/m.30693 type:complete len:90 (-) Transcript_30220:1538-1807(-)